MKEKDAHLTLVKANYHRLEANTTRILQETTAQAEASEAEAKEARAAADKYEAELRGLRALMDDLRPDEEGRISIIQFDLLIWRTDSIALGLARGATDGPSVTHSG